MEFLPECPICFEELLSSIFQCYEGHLICDNCVDKFKFCPICQQEMPPRKVRNREMEKIISSSLEKEKKSWKSLKIHLTGLRSEQEQQIAPSPSNELTKAQPGMNHSSSVVITQTQRIPSTSPIQSRSHNSNLPAERLSAFSPPTPTISKEVLEFLGHDSGLQQDCQPPKSLGKPTTLNTLISPCPDPDIHDRISSRRGVHSLSITTVPNLICFDDEIPELPSPPHSELLSPIPPPVPPRRNLPSSHSSSEIPIPFTYPILSSLHTERQAIRQKLAIA